MYQEKCLKCKEPNILNQIYSIKPTKLSQSNQNYQTKSRETKSTKNQSRAQYQPELSFAQISPSLFFTFLKPSDWLKHSDNLSSLSPLHFLHQAPLIYIKYSTHSVTSAAIYNIIEKYNCTISRPEDLQNEDTSSKSH